MFHCVSIECLRFFQLKPEPQQTQGRENTQPQSYSPCSPKMVFSENQHRNHWDQVCHDKSEVYLDVCEQYEIPFSIIQNPQMPQENLGKLTCSCVQPLVRLYSQHKPHYRQGIHHYAIISILALCFHK